MNNGCSKEWGMCGWWIKIACCSLGACIGWVNTMERTVFGAHRIIIVANDIRCSTTSHWITTETIHDRTRTRGRSRISTVDGFRRLFFVFGNKWLFDKLWELTGKTHDGIEWIVLKRKKKKNRVLFIVPSCPPKNSVVWSLSGFHWSKRISGYQT